MRNGSPTFVVVEIPEDGNAEGTVVGYAQWDAPAAASAHASKGHWEDDRVPSPGSLDEAKLLELYVTLEAETKRVLGPEGHSNMYYLLSVAVDPAHQRRGIGRMLVLHGLDLAAKTGLDAFLHATPEGEGLYRSLGFQQVGEPFDLFGTNHFSMLWKHQSSASP
ncbi:9669af0b-78f2-40ae-8598-ccbcdd4e165f [Thermothielavioides terrestris]|uniref:9669af0b-78f2-40ae-8598-ccbcdd4e165f n=1 Tax=Thermothielavioides terrestris TaxID=2587410 RepID=A0A3S4EVA4_9PEZI|nr:9669af0b-78f2-40ae-8598-ccbcdd4e165f [Thermothielavioides terrestris]